MSKSVSILVSLYKPNEQYLIEQLESIKSQDYRDFEVVIYNDCPEDINRASAIAHCLEGCTMRYYHGEQNVGYTKAFETLVLLAKGEYLAFCDQDDIWTSSRLREGVKALDEGHVLAVCDRAIINEHSNIVIESWKASHPRNPEVNWKTGDSFTAQAAFTCYAIGMATMVRKSAACSFTPFPACTGHDLWVALCASAVGTCSFIDKPLVMYRRHSNNVTGTFSGIKNKRDWYRERVENKYELSQVFRKRFPDNERASEICDFAQARMDRNIQGILKHRSLAPIVAYFEIVLKFLPDPLFKAALSLRR